MKIKSSKQQTGMQGVFLVAAELAGRGLIVSPTSRSAKGADLLVTDQECARAWSVQVKTNAANTSWWLVGENAKHMSSESHIYVLVNLLEKEGRVEYFVISSRQLRPLVKVSAHDKSTFWYVDRKDVDAFKDAWSTFTPEGGVASDQGAA